MALMQRTIDAIPPADIVTVFIAHPGPGRTDQLWNTFGAATISRLADGAKTLAMLWNAAWREGGGETIDAAGIKPLSKPALQSSTLHTISRPACSSRTGTPCPCTDRPTAACH